MLKNYIELTIATSTVFSELHDQLTI